MIGDKRPVLSGFVALVAVAAVIGLLLGVGTALGARMAGLSEESDGSTRRTGDARESLYLPSPEPTKTDDGPQVTLAPGQPTPSKSSEANTAMPKPKKEIRLNLNTPSVGVYDNIELNGLYREGEGAILQVQRKEEGSWTDFPVTAAVSGGQFSTYIQTAHTGENVLRVLDKSSGLASNEVTVTVGG